jgi:hypothetical protein
LFIIVVVRVFLLEVLERLVRILLQLRVRDVLLVRVVVCLVLIRRRRIIVIRLLVRILSLVY